MQQSTQLIYVVCPTCKQQVEWSPISQYRPFCSKRCQLIDLGDWADENNRIPTNEGVIHEVLDD